ncbi:MAG TPA: polysaccharide biosynthesis/export family protein [Deltaproteobacteria bacterium]|nr:polysaccharide biosynthesis/export family protein [Deltaproteobacteria bacterium]
MKKISLILSILVLALASSACAAPEGALGDAKKTAETKAAPAPAAVQERPYLIGPSDVLDISVWGEAALSRQVTVRTDGFISLPLVGDIAAVGKSPSQLQKGIENSLMKFIKDPHCAVIVVEPRSKRFYVEGQVVRPGFFLLDQDMNLTQAISLAGGFTQWADKNSIVILRSLDGRQMRIKADYGRIVKGKDKNIAVHAGDTIIIP